MSEPENSGSAAPVETATPKPTNTKGVADYIADVAEKLQPVWKQLKIAEEKAQPYVKKADAEIRKLWEAAQPYHLGSIVPALLGLALVFYGGWFPTLVCVVEAVRASGSWAGIQESFQALKNNYLAAKAAQDKDDKVDADADGVPDVQQIDIKTLVERRASLFLKSVNGEQVSGACQRLATALFAVLATLRLRLAHALTFGFSLAEIAAGWCGAAATDAVAKSLPEENRRLAPTVVAGALRFAGFVFAWAFARVVLAFTVAQRGGALAVNSLIDLAMAEGKLSASHLLVQRRAAVGAGLGALGFVLQLWRGVGATPFILARLALLPVSSVEWGLDIFFGILV